MLLITLVIAQDVYVWKATVEVLLQCTRPLGMERSARYSNDIKEDACRL